MLKWYLLDFWRAKKNLGVAQVPRGCVPLSDVIHTVDVGDVAYRSASVDSVVRCRRQLISNDDLVILAQVDMTPCECAARSRLIYDKADQVCPLQRQLL